ncbi:type I-E CRISPR-associated protein Cas6/Cse3/CasE [Bradyrhizobium sp. Cp5.3]|uniref:type I-E CRISPR-associated protein Cas6/Cse3/CasE n=1 Tax=Bradyrhizobium sp. Cp5.3 TaxID=443598 RepID=UPI00047F2535|nr:type I-E CRISPR-associated protein Cas6/Cse3/CasE [Bradyrhizobium sp. Cp5.3]
MRAFSMVRLDPDIGRAMEWGAREKLLKPGGDDGYLWHALLVAAFGRLAPKPFRLIEPNGRRPPHLLGYAHATEEGLHRHVAAFCDPAIASALGVSSLAVKVMPDSFVAGRRLGFELRVRPVVRQTKDGDRNRKREIDVFLHQTRARPDADKPSRVAVYADWLAAHLAKGGAALDTMRIIWLRRSAITRRDRERELRVHGEKGGGPDACFGGALTVTDPIAFNALLARGVGRHRAFGFGMLLLKPLPR